MPVLKILYFLEQVLMKDTMILHLQPLLLLFDVFNENHQALTLFIITVSRVLLFRIKPIIITILWINMTHILSNSSLFHLPSTLRVQVISIIVLNHISHTSTELWIDINKLRGGINYRQGPRKGGPQRVPPYPSLVSVCVFPFHYFLLLLCTSMGTSHSVGNYLISSLLFFFSSLGGTTLRSIGSWLSLLSCLCSRQLHNHRDNANFNYP